MLLVNAAQFGIWIAQQFGQPGQLGTPIDAPPPGHAPAWLGLFASPGGLLIIGGLVSFVALIVCIGMHVTRR
jgi:hypothetical protein